MLTLLTASGSRAFANDSWSVDHPEIEIAAGYELETMGEMTRASLERHDGARISAHLSGPVFENSNSLGEAQIIFLPLYLVFDPNPILRAAGIEPPSSQANSNNSVRKVVGALVTGTLFSQSLPVGFRAKLAVMDYDREKGLFDWRIFQGEFVIRKTFPVNANTAVEVETAIGVSAGGNEIKSLADLERALGLERGANQFFTLNAIALARLGLTSGNWRAEAIASFEQRLDVTQQTAEYLGHRLSAQSQKFRVDLRGEYVLWKLRRRTHGESSSVALFGDLALDYDNLTAVHILFNIPDAYAAIWAMGGVKIRF